MSLSEHLPNFGPDLGPLPASHLRGTCKPLCPHEVTHTILQSSGIGLVKAWHYSRLAVKTEYIS